MDGRYIPTRILWRNARRGLWPTTLALLALAGGCQSEDPALTGAVHETSGATQAASQTPSQRAAAIPASSTRQRETPQEYVPGPGPAPDEPEVLLTSHMQELSPVQVGDAAPGFTLPAYSGGESSLSELCGQKLTVLVFWTSEGLYAAEQFLRLENEVVEPYSSLGVGVVAVHVGESSPALDRLISQAQPNFAVLVDADGAVFHRYATELLPRTYLLDSQGHVLWFDIEYSRSTRRELDNAIRYHLLESQ